MLAFPLWLLVLLSSYKINAQCPMSWIESTSIHEPVTWDNSYMSKDVYGNIYLANSFDGNVMVGDSVFSPNVGTSSYVAKFDSLGNFLRAKQIVTNGSGNHVHTVINDQYGNGYVIGSFSDSISFGDFTLVNTNSTQGSIFIWKFDQNLNTIWAIYAWPGPGPTNMTVRSAEVQGIDAIVFAGDFSQGTFHFGSQSISTFRPTYFVSKISMNGVFEWVRTASVPLVTGRAFGFGVTPDSNGNIVVVGTFVDSMYVGAMGLWAGSNGGGVFDEGFIVKYDSTGALLWAKQFEPVSVAGKVELYDVAADRYGNYYITGNYWHDTCKLGSAIFYGPTSALPEQSLLIKIDSNGNYIWSKEVTGSRTHIGDLRVSSNDQVYLLGKFEFGPVTIDTVTFTDPTITSHPFFIYSCDLAGNMIFANSLQQSSYRIDKGGSIEIHTNGNIAVEGSFRGTIVTPDTVISGPSYSAPSDKKSVFIMELSPTGEYVSNGFAGNDIQVTCGDSIRRDINLSEFNTFSWIPNSGLIQNSSNSTTFFPTQTTDYFVSVQSGTCIFQDTLQIDVTPLSVATGNDTSIVCGNPMFLSAWSNSPYSIFDWNPGSIVADSSSSFTQAFPLDSTEFIVSVTTPNGCATDKDTVNIFLIPLVASNSDDTVIYCGDTISLFANANTSGVTYQWTPSIGLSNSQVNNPMAFPTISAIYTMTASHGNCVFIDTVDIQVLKQSNFTWTTNGMVVSFSMLDSDCAQNGFTWDYGNGNTSSIVQHPTVTYLAPGTYSVCLKCGQQTIINCITCTNIIVPSQGSGSTGIPMPYTKDGEFSIYPIPAHDALNVEFSGFGKGKYIITLLDNFGRSVKSYSKIEENGKNTFTIPLDKLSPGLYYLQFSFRDRIIFRKFVLE